MTTRVATTTTTTKKKTTRTRSATTVAPSPARRTTGTTAASRSGSRPPPSGAAKQSVKRTRRYRTVLLTTSWVDSMLKRKSFHTWKLSGGRGLKPGIFAFRDHLIYRATQAALGYQEPGKKELSWLCAGSLISDQYVLTAAHCCNSAGRSPPVRVQLGTLDVSSARAGATRYGIRDVIVHPDYSRSSFQADVALLRLDRRVSFSRTVSPACLYADSEDPQGSLTVAGWGATNAIGTKQSPVLQKGTVRSLPFSRCRQYRQRFPEGLDSSVICAGDTQGVVSICGGDSGGPLLTKVDTFTYAIVGITSIGPSPCGGNIPSLYTRVSRYIDWIEKHVWR